MTPINSHLLGDFYTLYSQLNKQFVVMLRTSMLLVMKLSQSCKVLINLFFIKYTLTTETFKMIDIHNLWFTQMKHQIL